MRKKIEDVGGRRFLLALGAGVMTTVLQWFGKIDAAGNTYSIVIIATVAAYITNNTWQKKSESEAPKP